MKNESFLSQKVSVSRLYKTVTGTGALHNIVCPEQGWCYRPNPCYQSDPYRHQRLVQGVSQVKIQDVLLRSTGVPAQNIHAITLHSAFVLNNRTPRDTTFYGCA